jgi:hypothetical protein
MVKKHIYTEINTIINPTIINWLEFNIPLIA